MMSTTTNFTTQLPTELLVILLCTVASNGGDYASVSSLAQTCSRLNTVLSSSRSVWTALFSSKFDIHHYHILDEYNIQVEYKTRIHLLHNTSQEQGRVECIKTLVFEHREKNLPLIQATPTIPSSVALELKLVLQTFSSTILELNQTRQRDWLLVCSILAMSNPEISQKILTPETMGHISRLELGVQLEGDPFYESQTLELALLRHLWILRLLHNHPPSSLTYSHLLPSGEIWAGWTGLHKGRTLTKNYLLHAFQTLRGRWTGYYEYSGWNSDRLDEPMTMTLEFRSSASRQIASVLEANNGRDGVGTFTMHGTVDSEGNTSLLKVYGDGVQWTYNGVILPFGIVGAWDGGFFWIWKEVETPTDSV